MSEIKVIEGGTFKDFRGKLSYVNDLDLKAVRRFYTITNENTDIVRAWQAHKHESKWFYCVRGAFTIALVKIDDWENPSKDLKPEVFHLKASESRVICVPAGYANGMKAEEPDSMLIGFSDKTLPETEGDNYRFDKELWMKW